MMHLDWQRNLGSVDRIIRAMIGVLLFSLVFMQVLTGTWAVLAVLFALFQLAEAFYAY